MNIGIHWFIGGPHASSIVFDSADVEPVIAALCKRTGDDQDDYTATLIGSDGKAEKDSPDGR